jgi:hypothetical protein
MHGRQRRHAGEADAAGGRRWLHARSRPCWPCVALRYNATELFSTRRVEPRAGVRLLLEAPLIAWIIRVGTDGCLLSESGVRLPSPLIHTATASSIPSGRGSVMPGSGSGRPCVFAMLPGVSLSAGIFSTDVPLLFF